MFFMAVIINTYRFFSLDFWTSPTPNAVQRDRRGQRWATLNWNFHAAEGPLLRYQKSGGKKNMSFFCWFFGASISSQLLGEHIWKKTIRSGLQVRWGKILHLYQNAQIHELNCLVYYIYTNIHQDLARVFPQTLAQLTQTRNWWHCCDWRPSLLSCPYEMFKATRHEDH